MLTPIASVSHETSASDTFPSSDAATTGNEICYRQIFESARDGILILDEATGCITEVNPYFLELFGYSRAQLLGKTIESLGSFKDVLPNVLMLKQLRTNGYLRQDSVRITAQDGRNLTLEITCNAHSAQGRELIQCNFRDISQRTLQENAARLISETLEQRVAERTALLQTANEELEAFSYSVSHDLRAPLRQVMGFVKLLQQSAGPKLDEKDLRFLQIISDSAKRMGNLIDDLLAFSRVGRAELRMTEVKLDELVQEALSILEQEIKNRKIKWKIDPLPSVWTDRVLMLMVLTNLISNAVKFTGKREEACIEIGVSPSSDQETIIYILDNGAGFDQKYVDKLFRVFQRLHGENEFDGTGIGLANVERIITRHGGRVWARGVVEGGAAFFFSVPKLKRDTHES